MIPSSLTHREAGSLPTSIPSSHTGRQALFPPWFSLFSHREAGSLPTMVPGLHTGRLACPPWYPGYIHREACMRCMTVTYTGRHVCAEVPRVLRERGRSMRRGASGPKEERGVCAEVPQVLGRYTSGCNTVYMPPWCISLGVHGVYVSLLHYRGFGRKASKEASTLEKRGEMRRKEASLSFPFHCWPYPRALAACFSHS